MNAALAEHALLRFGALLFSTYNGACMAHGAAFGCRDARDESDDGLGAVLLDPACGLDLEVAADFTDHDDAVGLVVGHQELNRFEGGGADDGVTADADGRGLAHAGFGHLVHRFVGQRSGLGDDADAAGVEDEAGHDADFGFARCDDAGAVRADEGAIALVDVRLDLGHVRYGNALGDGHDDLDAGVCGFHDGVACKCGRHEDDARISTGRFNRFADGVEHRLTEVLLAAFSGGHTANHLRTVIDHLTGVECSFSACKTLDDDF